MVNSVRATTAVLPTPLTPLRRFEAASAVSAGMGPDQYGGTPSPSVKDAVAGVWNREVVGDSKRSYRITLPKDVPAGYVLDEAAMDPRDRQEMAKFPHLRPMFTRLDFLFKTDSQAKAALQDFYSSMRNGDVVLRTYGTVGQAKGLNKLTGISDPSGPGTLNSLAIASTGGAWSHVAVVVKPRGSERPQVVEAVFEGGVQQSGMYTFLAAMVDPIMLERRAVTLVRPTENQAVADVAAAYAQSQVGQRYNFPMLPHGPGRGLPTAKSGFYCSQLVYESFDANPAIRKPVFGIRQAATAANRSQVTHALVTGLRLETTLNHFYQETHGHTMTERIRGGLKDWGHSWLGAEQGTVVYDGLRSAVVIGRVLLNTAANTVRPGSQASPKMAVHGRAVPVYITPGEMAPNDGRKQVTLLFDS